MIEPLPPALAALIAAERSAPVASSAARIAIKAKLAASIAAAPLGMATAGFGAGKIIAIVALSIGAGTATVAAVKAQGRGESRAVPRQVAASAHPVPVPTAPVVLDVPPAPLVAQAPASPPATPSAVRSRPLIASQPELLRDAWTALSQSDSQRALELVELDVRVHPAGALDEERGALAIVALARLGRLDRATRAAEAFAARYPHSIHHSLIAKTLGGVP
jgi:hypothetical protein